MQKASNFTVALQHSGVETTNCYNGAVVPILIVRFDPHRAEKPRQLDFGRAACRIQYLWGIRRARVPLGSCAINRPDWRAGLRSYGGRKLRTVCAGLLALALASCAPSASGGDGNEAQAASDQPSILDLLKTGDIASCAHPNVMALFNDNSRISFEDAQKRFSLTRDQYDAVEPTELSFTNISATNANKDILEVQCEANLKVFGQDQTVTYSVRPESGGPGIVVSSDQTIAQIMALNKAAHMRALAMVVPMPREVAAPSTQSGETSGDPVGEAQPATEAPMSAYEKAKAALDQRETASGNH